jgi:hypothetical protein
MTTTLTLVRFSSPSGEDRYACLHASTPPRLHASTPPRLHAAIPTCCPVDSRRPRPATEALMNRYRVW